MKKRGGFFKDWFWNPASSSANIQNMKPEGRNVKLFSGDVSKENSSSQHDVANIDNKYLDDLENHINKLDEKVEKLEKVVELLKRQRSYSQPRSYSEPQRPRSFSEPQYPLQQRQEQPKIYDLYILYSDIIDKFNKNIEIDNYNNNIKATIPPTIPRKPIDINLGELLINYEPVYKVLVIQDNEQKNLGIKDEWLKKTFDEFDNTIKATKDKSLEKLKAELKKSRGGKRKRGSIQKKTHKKRVVKKRSMKSRRMSR